MRKKTIKEVQDEIVETFFCLEDSFEKLSYLIDFSGRLLPYDNTKIIKENKVSGCLSNAWIYCSEKNDKVNVSAYSDSLVIKGTLALLVYIFDGRSSEEIINSNIFVFDKVNIEEFMPSTRNEGIRNIIKKIKCQIKILEN